MAVSDVVADFINNFLDSLTTDPVLSNSLSSVKTDLSNTFTANSASSFFTGLLTTLLDALKAMLVAAIAVGKAMVDGVLAVIGDVIDAIWSAIADPIDFPVISWLYQLLFGEPLTLLNLVTLVAAIPVTIIYRIATGEYPQDSSAAQQAQLNRQGVGPRRVEDGILAAWQQRAMGTAVAIFNLVYGLINAFNDFMYNLVKQGTARGFGPLIGWLGNLAVGLGLINCTLTYPNYTNDLASISEADWIAYGFSCFGAFLAINGLSNPSGDSLFGLEDGTVVTWGVALAIVYVLLLVATVLAFQGDGKNDVNTDLGFASGIIGCLPSIINPIKFLPGQAGLAAGVVDAIVDVFAGAATCALTMAATWRVQSALPRQIRRLYFPFVPHAPRPAQAHPLALASAAP
jgi:hypothetical protein